MSWPALLTGLIVGFNIFVLVYFHPTQTKGVFLSIDNVKKSHSLSALPNRPLGKLGAKEEWMIRAIVNKPGKVKVTATKRAKKDSLMSQGKQARTEDVREIIGHGSCEVVN